MPFSPVVAIGAACAWVGANEYRIIRASVRTLLMTRISISVGQRPRLLRRELPRVDLRVQAEAVERGFFGGVGADGATDPEREDDAVHVPVVRVIQPVLDWPGLRRAAQIIGGLRVGILLLLRRGG